MSWSLSQEAAQAEARATFARVHTEQPAYALPGPHRLTMDRIASFAGDVAEAAPPDAQVHLNSSGHVGEDGHGLLTVTLAW